MKIAGVKFRSRMDIPKVLKKKERGRITGLKHGSAYLRRIAINSVKKSRRASKPGTPIHTRAGLAKRSILFAEDKRTRSFLIGARYSSIGKAFAAHERGGMFRGHHYPKRPVMVPAMNNSLPKLPASFGMRIIN